MMFSLIIFYWSVMYGHSKSEVLEIFNMNRRPDFQSLTNRLRAKFHIALFSTMLFVLPFRTEHSTYFILIKVCHFVGRLKHKCIISLQIKFYATIWL